MTPAAGLPLPVAGEPFTLPPDLEQLLGRQVAGQDPAIAEVCGTLRCLHAGPPRRRPAAVFLFAGPDGTGKATLARALAAVLFGSGEALVRLYMSECADQGGVMRLAGLMPCYPVPEEGRLVTALRSRPRCVVLLDELEKAHPDVLDLFLRLFEEGALDDFRGRPVDGRGALFVLATVAGSEAHAGASGSVGSGPERPVWEQERESVERAVRARFRPELLACVDRIVHLAPLSPGAVRRVLDLLLVPVQERLEAGWGIRLEVTPAAREHVCVQHYDPVQGARSLERAVDLVLLGSLARYLLEREPARRGAVVLDYDGREIVVRSGA